VTLKPAEVILPLGEFPIAGYKVLGDESRDRWLLEFPP
jgi:hypothetical protein